MKLAARLGRQIRQWRYPPAFRIQAAEAVTWSELLARAVEEVKRTREAASTAKPPEIPSPARDEVAEKDFFITLCNSNFRLHRNVDQMEKEGRPSKELRSIRRALDKVNVSLARAGVESIDLTGQDYDEGRRDFSPLSTEEVAGLERPQISVCERPLVLLQGKMIQEATGIVARPA